jgi:HK97 family phage prohead protease
MIRLTPKTLITVDAAAAEGSPRRSISGVAVTYDEVATVSDGTQVKILQGALPVDGRNPKLYMQHQSDLIIGQVVERVDTNEGMLFTAKISATTLGNDAMEMVKDGTIDAVSIGINPTKFSYDDNGVMIVEAAVWTELSLVSQGAFEGAVITEVAASIPQTDQSLDNNEKQDTTNEENNMKPQ